MKVIGKQAGFTVLELVVTMAIAAILIGIATISITEYRRRTAVKESARALEGIIYKARTAARTRQVPVSVRIETFDFASFIDNNGDGEFNAGDELLEAGVASGDAQFLGDPDEPPFVVPGTIVFSSIGTLNNAASSVRRVRVALASEPNRVYRVCVYQTGGTKVEWQETAGPIWGRAW